MSTFLRAAATAVLILGTCMANAQPVADRDPQIEALIQRMTLEEKAGQLSTFADEIRAMNPAVNPSVNRRKANDLFDEIRAGRIGSLFNGQGVEAGRRIQKVAVEESRMKIPVLFGADVIHGFRTVFPIPLAEASSFEPALAEQSSRVAAIEATSCGIHWVFAPMVDIARDQRWGRVAEGSGEDPYLGQLFAAARVRGFQGKSLKDDDSLLATPKHFAAYGAVAAGMDYNTVDISEQTLREVHLPPFKAAFDAGAITTMSSFNDINGVPATANHYLLTDILRGEWGFPGFVVSDYTADEELIAHGYAKDGADAVRLALTAGVDMSMQSGLYLKELPKLIQSGAVTVEQVNEAVRRVLRVKKAIGLFDNPYRSLDAQREKHDSFVPAHRQLARDVARRSIVMLKNANHALPLKKSANVALIGPFATSPYHLQGPWTLFGNASEAITLQQGLREVLQANGGSLTVVQGSDIEKPVEGGIEAAVAAAKSADVVLLAIGEGEGMSGEAQSRTDIVVPAPQQALAKAIAETGKPVVVLLRNGRALALDGAVRDADAILVTWFLGTETGHAVADVVFGDYNPSARLPVSFPYYSGQEPFFYNHKSTGRPQVDKKLPEFKARYRETANEALYPFGYGIGY
ncbi:MAG TPA: glycoside hydrolase family 3 N-terminal domain-containing protein, partial [Steroidobacteraceae bacterium]|nr:glycoside hydrolase family 3 N-terminal domain-containing protein [Steroidobacteraceae bacterium]